MRTLSCRQRRILKLRLSCLCSALLLYPLLPAVPIRIGFVNDGDYGDTRRTLLNTSSKCKILKLNIANAEIMRLYGPAQSLTCEQNPKNWVFVDENRKLQLTDYVEK
ncbi:hypothetical protein L596_004452 [Steinernema carpocapsae]|uniref:Uncharacterized protein n=1 Tax=Steinernema carpocapsae TaxID=34508 RepID=A0A4U8UVV0_STECR|nr:hypothetical protein L596_004452 [Steinernema carpocapsae]